MLKHFNEFTAGAELGLCQWRNELVQRDRRFDGSVFRMLVNAAVCMNNGKKSLRK
jgi:hypothetical protein